MLKSRCFYKYFFFSYVFPPLKIYKKNRPYSGRFSRLLPPVHTKICHPFNGGSPAQLTNCSACSSKVIFNNKYSYSSSHHTPESLYIFFAIYCLSQRFYLYYIELFKLCYSNKYYKYSIWKFISYNITSTRKFVKVILGILISP